MRGLLKNNSSLLDSTIAEMNVPLSYIYNTVVSKMCVGLETKLP